MSQPIFFLCLLIILASLLPLQETIAVASTGDNGAIMSEDEKTVRRNFLTSKAIQTSTLAVDAPHKRRVFPQKEPLVCLAFLSCCNRTDLLHQTLSGIIRHMENDEPSELPYMIAWIDNGSSSDLTSSVISTFEIEKALTLEKNMGLAFGMNGLIFNLCSDAPFILLLEEDWLYLDEGSMAKQTIERKHAISRGLALIMAELDGPGEGVGSDDRPPSRKVFGVKLRTEYPIADGISGSLLTSIPGVEEEQDTIIDYKIYCMDIKRWGHVFGSFTNGAGLYFRHALVHTIGRMYGEPDDVFHDAYVESNYAFRAGLKYCLAAISMGDDNDNDDCNTPNNDQTCIPYYKMAAFHHIGGGRGTRPAKRADIKMCQDDSWMFFGTPMYERTKAHLDAASSDDECRGVSILPDIDTQLQLNAEFQRINAARNEKLFAEEKAFREKLMDDATLMKKYPPSVLRANVPHLKDMSDEEITAQIKKLELMAKSPHQIPGFWDLLGQPAKRQDEL